MELVLPPVHVRQVSAAAAELAPRPRSLDGKVVGFLDGWGLRKPDGSFGMYPLMQEVSDFLQAQFDIKGTLWELKPNVSNPIPKQQLLSMAQRADVVVNGECA